MHKEVNATVTCKLRSIDPNQLLMLLWEQKHHIPEIWNFQLWENYKRNLGFTTREVTPFMTQHNMNELVQEPLNSWKDSCHVKHMKEMYTSWYYERVLRIFWKPNDVCFETILKNKMMFWMQSKNYLMWLNQNTYIWRMRSPTVISFSLKESFSSSASKYLSTSTRWAPKRIIWESPCGLIATTMHSG